MDGCELGRAPAEEIEGQAGTRHRKAWLAKNFKDQRGSYNYNTSTTKHSRDNILTHTYQLCWIAYAYLPVYVLVSLMYCVVPGDLDYLWRSLDGCGVPARPGYPCCPWLSLAIKANWLKSQINTVLFILCNGRCSAQPSCNLYVPRNANNCKSYSNWQKYTQIMPTIHKERKQWQPRMDQ